MQGEERYQPNLFRSVLAMPLQRIFIIEELGGATLHKARRPANIYGRGDGMSREQKIAAVEAYL